MTQITSKLVEDLVTPVVSKIKLLMDTGSLVLPKDYAPENAVRFAIEMIKEITVGDEKKPALIACSPQSVQNALYKMVIQGLDPGKSQCYFIVRSGKKLCCDRSYFGSQIVAKRFAGLKTMKAVVIYGGDAKDFKYEIDTNTGATKVISHVPKLDNQKEDDIVGAYVIYTLEDGSTDTVIRTIDQIREAWKMGAQKGKGTTHQNFPSEMCKRTVINYACKHLINASGDGAILGDQDSEENVKTVDKGTDGAADVGFSEFEVEDSTPTTVTETVKPEVVQQSKAEKTPEPKIVEPIEIKNGPGPGDLNEDPFAA